MNNEKLKAVPAARLRRILPALLALHAAAAFAQRDAAESGADAAPMRYDSAFADYKPWQDLQVRDWRQMNEAVAPRKGAGVGDPTLTPPSAAPAPARVPVAPVQAAPPAGAHNHGASR